MLAKIEVAARIMEHLVTCANHGYDQNARWGNGTTESITIEGQIYRFPTGDFDCSSAVLTAYKAAGININGATYTGNISSRLTATGKFERKPITFIASRGDLYLNDINHVAMCRQQVPDQLMEFSQNEFGGIVGGTVGDQTGWESRIGSYYNYPWNCIIHYIGEEQAAGNVSDNTTSTNRKDGHVGGGVVYEVHSPSFGWLGAVDKVDDSEEGYAGWMDSPIDGIRAYRGDGKPLTISVHMTSGQWLEATTFEGSLRGRNSCGDGYSGDLNSGTYIDAIKVSGADIRVAVAGRGYFGWLKEGATPEGDDYAGEDIAKKQAIVAVQMRCS